VETTTQSAIATDHTDQADRFTGVVVIHGIGNEKRNKTLEDAANALTYWFNHIAGLSLRPEGPSRVWLTTQLTDDPNPDALASRGTIELVPSPADQTTPEDGSPTRLKLREVWWAESFGLPSVASSLRWARLQFREDAARFLLPLGTHSGPKHLAVRHPARETPQALTYQPDAGTSDGVHPPVLPAEAPASPAHETLGHRITTTLLRSALRIYAVVQYVWKVLQWVALAPLIYLVLLLVGIVRLLAFIPLSFFQYTLVNGLVRLVGSLSLHWIAPLQVYLLDYTRSSAIRQRFEREVADFLSDEQCDRIVVIAHSMGTVIAYEGLTTILTQPNVRANQKPLTFICLAQALRRMWLLEGTDPHRLRRVLPERVRWLHFWARYDPVAAGPITPSSLPRLDEWGDLAMPDPHEAICASLASCENIDVVNTDSLFTDHTTYWENLEQVVGPIARELVVGHPALERLVAAHLATQDDILRRRWRVAWRASTALAAGILTAILFMLSDAGTGWKAGTAFRRLLGAVLNRVGHALLDGIYYYITGNNFGDVTRYISRALNALDNAGSRILGIRTGSSVLSSLAHNNVVYSAVTAIALAGIFVLLVGRVIAQPTSFAFRRSSPEASSATGGSFATSMIALVMLTIAALFVSYGGTTGATQALTLYQLGAYVGIVAWVLALISAVREHHWGWFAAIFLVSPILLFTFPVQSVGILSLGREQLELLALPGALVALIGCFVVLATAGGNLRRWPVATTFIIALIMLYALTFVLESLPFVPDVVKHSRLLSHSSGELFLVAPLLPILVYGLQLGAPHRGDVAWTRYAVRLSLLSTVSLVLAAIPYAVYFGLGYVRNAASLSEGPAFHALVFLAGISALVVGAAPWILGTLGTLRHPRLPWFFTMLLVTCGFTWLNLGLLEPVPPGSNIFNSFAIGDDCLLFSIALFTATLSFALWAGPPKPRAANG
jgi:hypothetical protein